VSELYVYPLGIRSEKNSYLSQGKFHFRSLATEPKCYHSVISLGCEGKPRGNLKPTLDWKLSSFQSREGSLLLILQSTQWLDIFLDNGRVYKIGGRARRK
jgi:hypothetical protein